MQKACRINTPSIDTGIFALNLESWFGGDSVDDEMVVTVRTVFIAGQTQTGKMAHESQSN